MGKSSAGKTQVKPPLSETPRLETSQATGPLTLTAGEADAGKRLDHFLQEQLRQYSRSRLQTWIKDGRVSVNATPARASHLLRGGEAVLVTPANLPPLKATPEAHPVDVLYEDGAVLAVFKPAGVVVHAGAGNHEGTLVNRLVHRFESLSHVGGDLRPGIVHRLDKDTSGVILVARTDAAHRALAAQFAARTVEKTYLALVHGHVRDESGRITKPIERDPVRRIRMTCSTGSGREAFTEYRVLKRFPHHTYLEVRIGTGRTHQIRVHLSNLGHPVAGDKAYGAPSSLPAPRLFLHAWRIAFDSPDTGERVHIEAPLPVELEQWLAAL
jgi:23S rRNA pseudouridine1911/1915/1917 synthase